MHPFRQAGFSMIDAVDCDADFTRKWWPEHERQDMTARSGRGLPLLLPPDGGEGPAAASPGMGDPSPGNIITAILAAANAPK